VHTSTGNPAGNITSSARRPTVVMAGLNLDNVLRASPDQCVTSQGSATAAQGAQPVHKRRKMRIWSG
jgi:hypothetical protein